MVEQLDSAQFLLITGRTGLGKTREALEIVRRTERAVMGGLTILQPKPPLTPPPLLWPDGLESQNIVLYLDNLHDAYFTRSEERGQASALAGDFATWLPSAVDHLTERFPGARLKVIGIVRDDLPVTWEARLRYSDDHPFWGRFQVVPPQAWDTEARPAAEQA